ncbi:MAG: flagellar hook-associated protein FlgK [Bdellovibrionota bacterium]
MSQSKGALAANQLGLATTSHNISNANTKGYSRQRVELQANSPVNFGRARVGTGVGVGAITRTTSDFVNKRLEEESSNLGQYESLNDVYTQLEADFGNEGETGVSSRIAKFFNDVRSLSTEPQSVPLRSAVRESANAVVSRFHGMRENFDAMVSDLDHRAEGSVAEINSLTSKIAGLNQRIVDVEITPGSFANDERDSRDLAVKDLAKLMPVQITELENGAISVSSGRAGVLVDPSGNYELAALRSPDPNHNSSMRIFTKEHDGTIGHDVTASLGSGSLGGIIQARDTVLPKVINKVDTLAYGFSNALNSVHTQGYGTNNQTNNELFTLGESDSVRGASRRIGLSDSMTNDLSSMASAQAPNSRGDNRQLLAIADLEDKPIFENGQANFTNYMSSMVGNMGVEARSVRENLDTQTSVMGQLDSMREETAGVSLDEEAINMLKFQKAFDANAKMIQVADSMMETVLNLKRF